ncbi:hypothetical protein K440DRAFT_257398 [Wilcoxina mikolae CBS 423.85]|nr:hypothetical protein K440DRAFT_257398 [Wilcoxina mikolae CBS 423.85]
MQLRNILIPSFTLPKTVAWHTCISITITILQLLIDSPPDEGPNDFTEPAARWPDFLELGRTQTSTLFDGSFDSIGYFLQCERWHRRFGEKSPIARQLDPAIEYLEVTTIYFINCQHGVLLRTRTWSVWSNSCCSVLNGFSFPLMHMELLLVYTTPQWSVSVRV